MKRKGITSIELLIVIIALAAVAAIVIPRLGKHQTAETTTESKTTIGTETDDGTPYVATLTQSKFEHYLEIKLKVVAGKEKEAVSILAFDLSSTEKPIDGTLDLFFYENIPSGHPLDLNRAEIQTIHEILLLKAAGEKEAHERN